MSVKSTDLVVVPSYLTSGPIPALDQKIILDHESTPSITHEILEVFNTQGLEVIRTDNPTPDAITVSIPRSSLYRIFLLLRNLNLDAYPVITALYKKLSSIFSNYNSDLIKYENNYSSASSNTLSSITDNGYSAKVDYIDLSRIDLKLFADAVSEFTEYNAHLADIIARLNLLYKPINSDFGLTVLDSDYINLVSTVVPDNPNSIVESAIELAPSEVGLPTVDPLITHEELELANYGNNISYSSVGINHELLQEMKRHMQTFFNSLMLQPCKFYVGYFITNDDMNVINPCASLIDQSWIASTKASSQDEVTMVKNYLIEIIKIRTQHEKFGWVKSDHSVDDDIKLTAMAKEEVFILPNDVNYLLVTGRFDKFKDLAVTLHDHKGRTKEKKLHEIKDVLSTLSNIWTRAKNLYLKHENLFLAGLGAVSGLVDVVTKKYPDINLSTVTGFFDNGPAAFSSSTAKAKYALNSKRLVTNVLPTLIDAVAAGVSVNSITTAAQRLLVNEQIIDDIKELSGRKTSVASGHTFKYNIVRANTTPPQYFANKLNMRHLASYRSKRHVNLRQTGLNAKRTGLYTYDGK